MCHLRNRVRAHHRPASRARLSNRTPRILSSQTGRVPVPPTNLPPQAKNWRFFTMTDNRSKESRSALMARIGGKDTAPEMIVRRCLHGRGFRYRLHVAGLPGKPDLVFPGRKKVVFVHGCFWHAHGCAIGRAPKSRLEYWLPKLQANLDRDRRTEQALIDLGWTPLTVWQCQTREPDGLAARLLAFLGEKSLRIPRAA